MLMLLAASSEPLKHDSSDNRVYPPTSSELPVHVLERTDRSPPTDADSETLIMSPTCTGFRTENELPSRTHVVTDAADPNEAACLRDADPETPICVPTDKDPNT